MYDTECLLVFQDAYTVSDCLFFVVFQMCTEVTMYFVHEDELSSLIYALSHDGVPRRKYYKILLVIFDDWHCCAVKHTLAFTLVCLQIFIFLFTCCWSCPWGFDTFMVEVLILWKARPTVHATPRPYFVLRSITRSLLHVDLEWSIKCSIFCWWYCIKSSLAQCFWKRLNQVGSSHDFISSLFYIFSFPYFFTKNRELTKALYIKYLYVVCKRGIQHIWISLMFCV